VVAEGIETSPAQLVALAKVRGSPA
jgi:hypothetical protein